MRNRKTGWIAIGFIFTVTPAKGQPPPQPVDPTPLNGEVYYLVNQLSGLQADLVDKAAAAGASIVQLPRSFTNLSQRWTLTRLSNDSWQISNLSSRLCLDSSAPGATHLAHDRSPAGPLNVCGSVALRGPARQSAGRNSLPACAVVQNPCSTSATQQWVLTPAGNGYYTISNKSTDLAIDLARDSPSAGTPLSQTTPSGVRQSQRWLLRPAFFRGVDNALLEKQEADRAALGLPWWEDAGQPQDVLRILKNHGVNMVRLRPSSQPPYVNVSQTQCSGNACYGETDAQDLDLARRARNLGLSIQLTLLFDGGDSAGVPPAWQADTELAQLQSDLYDYVKAEILAYRVAGVIPDLVSIGNEVDTGFLGSAGSPTGAAFGGFASLEIAAIQAVHDAASDTSAGPPIPAPLTCIHITPAWDLTEFFTLAAQNQITYDAICQSYYPFFHGPLTDAQAAAANPGNKPVEQDVLVRAANQIGKPVMILETAEHYQNGFDSNDPWYAPPAPALQRQFLLDLQNVLTNLPDNLGMGMAYWNPAGVNIPPSGGGLVNGDNQADAIYVWNGLTLFDAVTLSVLPALDALGGGAAPAAANFTSAPGRAAVRPALPGSGR